MFLLHGDAKYIDVLEKMLYNGLISGIGLDGKSFFYTNAMEVRNSFNHKDFEGARSGWFECSCCPTNLTRLIPSVPGYMYAQKEGNLFVNLFINSTVDLMVNNKPVKIEQQNNYPWDGDLIFKINSAAINTFNLLVRVPGWAGNSAVPSDLYKFETASAAKIVIKLNGAVTDYTIKNGYAVINKAWKKNDVVEVLLPMEVKRVVSNEKVTNDIGKVALQRGPIIYCAEWADNNGKTSNILMPANTNFTSEFKPAVLNGITVLKAEVPAVIISNNESISTQKQTFTAIPYYSWANRGKGEMTVWFPTQVKDIELLSK
jgi:uncharacterized protein